MKHISCRNPQPLTRTSPQIHLSEQTNRDPQDYPQLHHRYHHDTSVTSLDLPVDSTDGLHTLGPSCDHPSPSPSLHRLPSWPHTTNMPPPPRSPSVVSLQSRRSSRSARLYCRHEGATPRPRSPHHRNVPSAAGIATSLAPHSVTARPDSRLIASPGDDNFPGSPTVVAEGPPFLHITSHDVRRYQKNCFK